MKFPNELLENRPTLQNGEKRGLTQKTNDDFEGLLLQYEFFYCTCNKEPNFYYPIFHFEITKSYE